MHMDFQVFLFPNTLKKRLGRKPPMGILDSPPSLQASDHRGVWVELR